MVLVQESLDRENRVAMSNSFFDLFLRGQGSISQRHDWARTSPRVRVRVEFQGRVLQRTRQE